MVSPIRVRHRTSMNRAFVTQRECADNPVVIEMNRGSKKQTIKVIWLNLPFEALGLK